MATKLVIYFLVLSSLSGCLIIDKDYSLDIVLPATLQINNLTQQSLTLNSIYNSNDTQAGFVFTKKYKLNDPHSMQARIAQDAYTAFTVGHFWLEGHCGNIENWKLKGTDGLQKKLLTITPVDNEKEWKVIININCCE